MTSNVVLPFAVQDQDYVAEQYRQLFVKLAHEDRSELPLTDTYRDVYLLVRWAHVPLSHQAFLVVQLLTAAGAAWCWGQNTNGELGNHSTVESKVPVAVSGGIVFASISSGGTHACGVTAAGAAWSCASPVQM